MSSEMMSSDVMSALSRYALPVLAGVGSGLLLSLAIPPVRRSIFAFIEREQYEAKKRRKPKRLILIRHGESLANVDHTLYFTVPDNKIELSELGTRQAIEAGKKIKELVGDDKVLFYASPFRRTLMTFECISQAFSKSNYRFREEPRIREQEWGNFQVEDKYEQIDADRRKIGAFYYRFPEGESGADVYDRASSFIESLFREFDSKDKSETIILVTHGLFIRLFLMRYFRWSVEKFHKVCNPDNCEYFVMDLHPTGYYQLTTPVKMRE